MLGYHFPPVFFGHFLDFEFAPFFRCFVCFAATVRHIKGATVRYGPNNIAGIAGDLPYRWLFREAEKFVDIEAQCGSGDAFQ